MSAVTTRQIPVIGSTVCRRLPATWPPAFNASGFTVPCRGHGRGGDERPSGRRSRRRTTPSTAQLLPKKNSVHELVNRYFSSPNSRLLVRSLRTEDITLCTYYLLYRPSSFDNDDDSDTNLRRSVVSLATASCYAVILLCNIFDARYPRLWLLTHFVRLLYDSVTLSAVIVLLPFLSHVSRRFLIF